MLIHQFLENSAARFPDKVAVIHEESRATYRQINTAAARLAVFLVARGVRKGDRVALLMENSCQYVIAYYGILKTGAIAVPLSTDLKPDGLTLLIAEIEPAAIVASFRFERLLQASNLNAPSLRTLVIHNPRLDWDSHGIDLFSFHQVTTPLRRSKHKLAAQVRGGKAFHPPGTREYVEDLEKGSNKDIESVDVFVTSDDLASIIYTSGSTGKPKGAMLSHANLVANTLAICACQKLTESDIHMVVLPFFYVMGKSLLNTHIASGATVVLNNRFAYPATVLKQMVDEAVTGFSGVPSTYAFLLHRSPLKDFSSKLQALRFCAQAGGHMARKLKRELREVLPDHTQLFIMYGATEGSARFTFLDPQYFNAKIDSIGKPIPGVHITITDENDRAVEAGQTGELNASGPNVMSGYWKDSQTTANVLGPFGYRTGDMGYADEDGFLYLAGRKDDILKVGGHRVNIQEVEDGLLSVEGVVEAAVIGMKDDLLGHRLKAVIVFKDNGMDLKRVEKHCKDRLPRYKIPSDLIKVRTLPKKANGKIDRSKCRDLIESMGSDLYS
jgi:acyl-CoA synthetase (AMP-forming)/AMP-acid ligase II